MKVRVLRGFSGEDGLTYLKGQVCDFPEPRATALIDMGWVATVKDQHIEVQAKTATKKVAVKINGKKER